jgi:peptidoglycan hydrolase-like protein with peptidoglycan-binding domain
VAVATCAGLAVLTNVLFLQSGSHPAPLFGSLSNTQKAAQPLDRVPVPQLRRVNADVNSASATAVSRTPGEIITDMQRELVRRGYYEGPIDGLYGPKTDAAIREFEQAAGLKASAEPTEMLLQTMRRAPASLSIAKSGPASAGSTTEPAPAGVAFSPRVIALQRALSDYGYGQIKPTGIVDLDTQRAIEKFERERNLPVTRRYSERLVRELSAVTGRVLE